MSDPGQRRALVLGGGGVAGIAWESGLLTGLIAAGIDLAAADLVVGTSAGSAVAMLLRTGALRPETAQATAARPPAEAEQAAEATTPGAAGDATGSEALAFDGMRFMEMMQGAAAGGGSHQEARARLGQRARDIQVSMPVDTWLGRFSGTAPAEWPEGRLAITAVDAEDGTFRVLDAASGVAPARAVAASCTVPGVYPLVEIDGHLHMDGGMRSATNADVAAGHDRVLVVACSPEAPSSPFGPTLDESVEQLRTQGEAMVVLTDEASAQAFGANSLDPATSAPAFQAGWAQAQVVADDVRAFWQG